MDPRTKITPDLAAEVDAAESSNLLDVVVELAGDDSEAADMTAAKAAFARAAEPVTEVISASGGLVLEGAWLNYTLRARVPARAISEVAGADGVSALDVPHRLEAD
jgi:hypothetical protein